MIELTQDQRRAISGEKSPEILDPDTMQSYVMVPKEVFDRVKDLLREDADWSPDEQLRLLGESGKRAGWDAPEMDLYDNYDENRKRCPWTEARTRGLLKPSRTRHVVDGD